jgi:hypothetical protein
VKKGEKALTFFLNPNQIQNLILPFRAVFPRMLVGVWRLELESILALIEIQIRDPRVSDAVFPDFRFQMSDSYSDSDPGGLKYYLGYKGLSRLARV